jgi:hypothetical protein
MSSTMSLPVHSLPPVGSSCGCPTHTPLYRMIKPSVLFAPSIMCNAFCYFRPLCWLATGLKHSTLLRTYLIAFLVRQSAPPACMLLFTVSRPHMSTYAFSVVFAIRTSPHKLLTNCPPHLLIVYFSNTPLITRTIGVSISPPATTLSPDMLFLMMQSFPSLPRSV